MKIVIQRVSRASVSIDNKVYSSIGKGMLILVGIEDADDENDIEWLCKKVIGLRIFPDENGVMNLPVTAIQGEILVVSQFTLHASTKKGNRPSYIKASKPGFAIPMYENFCKKLSMLLEKEVKTGVFGADMQVDLNNDGPVTLVIDSKNPE